MTTETSISGKLTVLPRVAHIWNMVGLGHIMLELGTSLALYYSIVHLVSIFILFQYLIIRARWCKNAYVESFQFICIHA